MKSKRFFLTAGFLFLLFATFTVVVTQVDVRPIGPEQSAVGLATLNQFLFTHIGAHPLWDSITDVFLLIALSPVPFFAGLGFTQMIRRKSVFKVDTSLLMLGAFYGLVAAVYIFFELVVINYRPVLSPDGLEPSYPSSHVLLVLCILLTTILILRQPLVHRPRLYNVLRSMAIVIMVGTVTGRLLAGVHWFTDIVGAVLLSAALVMCYHAATTAFHEQNNGPDL